MFLKIPRCYDSHCHLLGTGKILSILNLRQMKSPHDILHMQISESSYQNGWLIGFGWDQHRWDRKLPHRNILDQRFPDTPVALSRADGHGIWVNSKALEMIGLLNQNSQKFPDPVGGVIVRDSDDLPTGVLIDTAKLLIDFKIPPNSRIENLAYLKKGIEYFNQAGFSHVRDMTSSVEQFELAHELEQNGQLNLAIEHNFTAENFSDLNRAIQDALFCRQKKSELLRVLGVKIFLDGSLGSEGAYLSEPYSGTKERGALAWTPQELKDAFRKIWNENLEVAVHCIGDQATAIVLDVALDLKKDNCTGKLNLEHVQVLKDSSIQKMKELNVVCHLQPCHWLSDRAWLREKLGSLYPFVFRWADLEQAQVPFYFGSDSPIEESSISNNLKALNESVNEGIRPIESDIAKYHSHPDQNWRPQVVTQWSHGKMERIGF